MFIHSYKNYCIKPQIENLTFSQMTFSEISRLNRTAPLNFDINFTPDYLSEFNIYSTDVIVGNSEDDITFQSFSKTGDPKGEITLSADAIQDQGMSMILGFDMMPCLIHRFR